MTPSEVLPDGESGPLQAGTALAEAPPPGPGSTVGEPSRGSGLTQVLTRYNTTVVTALAIFSAFVVGAVVMIATSPQALAAWASFPSNPGGAVITSWTLVATAYSALLGGSLGNPGAYLHAFTTRTPAAWDTAFNPLSETLVAAAPLLLAGLSVSLAFKAGLFNIGGPSQVIAGAITAGWVGMTMPGLPLVVHMPLAVLAGLAGGAVAGWIPGILRARTGANEVIVTIMLNYVALNLLVYLLSLPVFLPSGHANAISRPTLPSAQMPLLAGGGLRVNAGIILAALVTVGVALLLRRTTLGFHIRMLGASPGAARAAGVSSPRIITVVFILAGGMCGLAGAVEILGVSNQLVPNYGLTIGFTAIIVALLGRARPGGVALAALLFGAFQAGGLQMQASTSVPIELVQVIEAVIVFFIAAPALIRAIYRIRTTGGGLRLISQGWGG
ncbi:MAG: ABC transporter permease [Candidatus Dormibacteria bacterium]